MGILGVPNEILLCIVETLSIKELYYFLSTCRKLSFLLTPRLHELGVRDVNGVTALGWAAEHGHASLAELAIASGAEVDKPTGYFNKAPIFTAAERDHPDVIRVLVAHGARVDGKGFLRTPLEAAVRYGAVEATRALLEGNTDMIFWGAPVRCAAHGESIDCMKALVAAGIDLNTKKYRNDGILHRTARGTARMMEYLLGHEELRMGINDQDRSGRRPLHLAVFNSEIVRVLLRHGADMLLMDLFGETPAHSATSRGQILSLMAFRDAGFDINTRGSDGRTLLHSALQMPWAAEMVELLVEQMGAGVIINVQDNEGRTPLDLAAARTDRGRITELLVRHGADWEVQDISGRTPADTMSGPPTKYGDYHDSNARSDSDPDLARTRFCLRPRF